MGRRVVFLFNTLETMTEYVWLKEFPALYIYNYKYIFMAWVYAHLWGLNVLKRKPQTQAHKQEFGHKRRRRKKKIYTCLWWSTFSSHLISCVSLRLITDWTKVWGGYSVTSESAELALVDPLSVQEIKKTNKQTTN